ncbi:MAG: DUF3556 domain-containing protein [Solirubrobacterales bacterium]|nr:DUF3556 domain-containing protein [Solirubrobacterales bacterium]OJU94402.1 MAG: hypothetical protein BGO23_03080 [Solirubrobacterales bacterium 67-14]
MGFISPSEPPFEIDEWRGRSYRERLKPLAQDWAVNGIGVPQAVYLLYIVKLVVYAGGGLLLISATSDLGGLSKIGDWWYQPVVFQKAVVWTMLWEALGLGAGSLPLTLRFSPMVGGFLHWLRPGTIRQPPWPGKVPLTGGDRRTIFDVVIYAAFVIFALHLLVASGATGFDPYWVAGLLAILVALGLRDKIPFLAARAEVYGPFLLIFLFPADQMIVAAQFVVFCIWWGAAASKLNRHFPFVVTVMISNTPWNRSRWAKRKLYRNHPEDLLPSRVGELSAHLGTVIEFTLPLILIASSGGTIGTIAVAGMVIFHLHILSTFPLAVPLEWNVFMIFGVFFLFGHYGDVPLSTLDDPLLIICLAPIIVGIPILGNFRPDLVSFLPSMRYYAGNWATSQWYFNREKGSEAKLDEHITKAAKTLPVQLGKFYEPEMNEVLLHKGLAFRSMHSHGRALVGLGDRAVDEIEDYDVREGETIAGMVCGYNFGDGHFHDHRLLASIQSRVGYEPGELRVVTLESQPAADPVQRYRIYDAADGLIEQGTVRVADMVVRQPWLGVGESFPVQPDPGTPD